MEDMMRVKTGIAGLDDMLNGGIPKQRHIAVFGGPGSGKSSFCFEYVYRGAKAGEKGIYITLEETPEDMISNMKATFSLMADIDDLIEKKDLEVIKPEEVDLLKVAEIIEDRIINNKIERVAIDSATFIKLTFVREEEYRKTLFEFFSLLRNLSCTSMLVLEASSDRRDMMRYDVEHYVMDGIVNLYNLDRGDKRIRALEIMKMRGTDHSRELVPFKVTPSGIRVYVGEKVF